MLDQFVDEQGQNLNRFTLTPVDGQANTYDLIRAAEIITPGTPISADTMNPIVDEITAHTGDEEVHIASAEREKWNMGGLVSGSNEVGSYLKFPDGSMIEWGVVTVKVPAGGYKSGFVQFPVAFKDTPSITATAEADTAKGSNTTQLGTLSNKFAYIFVYSTVPIDRTAPIHWHAIGRWK